jgi:hypothetical protein
VRWRTDDVKAALSKVPGVGHITAYEPGGDYDTHELRIGYPHDGITPALFVSGFRTDRPMTEAEVGDCDIQMVEVSTGKDSRGGSVGASMQVVQMHLEVSKALAAMGFVVVPGAEDYF